MERLEKLENQHALGKAVVSAIQTKFIPGSDQDYIGRVFDNPQFVSGSKKWINTNSSRDLRSNVVATVPFSYDIMVRCFFASSNDYLICHFSNWVFAPSLLVQVVNCV
jgi:hypothetical protein